MRVLISSLVIVCLFDYSCPNGIKWNLIVIWICIFLVTNDAERIFMCLSVIFVSSLEKCLFGSFASFKIGLFIFL